MTTTPEEPPTDEQVEEQLTALEAAAAAAITAALAGALTQLPPVPLALPGTWGRDTALAADHLTHEATRELTDQTTTLLTQAATLAHTAAAGTPPTDPTTIRRLIATTLDDVHADIVQALTDTAAALGTTLPINPTPPSQQLARLARTLTRTITTWLYGTYNQVFDHTARALGRTTEWGSEEDTSVCPVCNDLDGTTPTGPDGTYQSFTNWTGFTGLPPAHPWCRCKLRIRRSDR